MTHVQHFEGDDSVPCYKLMGSSSRDGAIPFNGTPPAGTCRSDKWWRPLCRLVELMPALTDVIFDSPNPFPLCLLEKLRSRFNTLRLRIRDFQLMSLGTASIDPAELALVSSPLLYSIWIRCVKPNGYKYPRDHAKIINTVKRLAPNLKELRLFRRHGDGRYDNGMQIPLLPLRKGFQTVERAEKLRA